MFSPARSSAIAIAPIPGTQGGATDARVRRLVHPAFETGAEELSMWAIHVYLVIYILFTYITYIMCMTVHDRYIY